MKGFTALFFISVSSVLWFEHIVLHKETRELFFGLRAKRHILKWVWKRGDLFQKTSITKQTWLVLFGLPPAMLLRISVFDMLSEAWRVRDVDLVCFWFSLLFSAVWPQGRSVDLFTTVKICVWNCEETFGITINTWIKTWNKQVMEQKLFWFSCSNPFFFLL